ADLAVAVFVLLARAAWAGLVAANLGLGTRRRGGHGNVVLFAVLLFRRQRRGVSVLELHALGHGFGFATQAGLFFGRVFATHLNMAEHADGVALDRLQQLLEQGEGLALVFLLGVLLRVAAQVNAVAQVIHGRQMVFPQIVQYTQQNLLLEGTQGFGAGLGLLLVVRSQQLGEDALAQGLLVQLVVFVQPLLNRQFDAEVALQGSF